ncbi:MAG: hypothetical protein ABIR56_13310 [Polaromonas sp.]
MSPQGPEPGAGPSLHAAAAGNGKGFLGRPAGYARPGHEATPAADRARHDRRWAQQRSGHLSGEVAVRLLRRSIDFGHGKLSVLRLAMAVNCGAQIATDDWRYCREIAASSADALTQRLFQQAVQSTCSGLRS